MAQEIGIRICNRERVRSGGHQDRATSYRHGNQPRHTRMAIIIMATPAMRAEAPASGKQGCPE